MALTQYGAGLLSEFLRYSMKNFDAFLQVVGWCGFEYGAAHLRLPKKEEDGSWWKTTKDGKVNGSPGYRFEVRVQSPAPM